MNSLSSTKKGETEANNIALNFISQNKQNELQSNESFVKITTNTSTRSDSLSFEDTKSSISEDSYLINQNTILSKIEEIELNDKVQSRNSPLPELMSNHQKINTLELENTIALSNRVNHNQTIEYDFYIQSNTIYNEIMRELFKKQLTNDVKLNIQLLAYNWFKHTQEKNDYINNQKDQDSYYKIQLNLFASLLFIDKCHKPLDKKEIEFYFSLLNSSKKYLLYLLKKKIVENNLIQSKIGINNNNKSNHTLLLQCQNLLIENTISLPNTALIKMQLASFLISIEENCIKLFPLINKKNKSFRGLYEIILLNHKKSFAELWRFIHLSIYFQNKIEEIEAKESYLQSQNIFIDTSNCLLPPKKKNEHKKYTLVLDLDETLVHYIQNNKDNSSYIQIRDGNEEFIALTSKYYEIVIFTASLKEVSLFIHLKYY